MAAACREASPASFDGSSYPTPFSFAVVSLWGVVESVVREGIASSFFFFFIGREDFLSKVEI